MATNDAILAKIKLLLKLSESPEPNEAASAKAMANKMIVKYSISEEELLSIVDKKPAYSDDEKLFHSHYIVAWKNKLALAIASKLDCQIVQEILVPAEGDNEYIYFVLGEESAINRVKHMFALLVSKVEEILLLRCINRGVNYNESFSEGMIEGIKENLEYEDFFFLKKEIKKETGSNNEPGIVVQNAPKEKVTEEKTNVNSQSFIKDVMAYFAGVREGRHIDLADILELENGNERKAFATGAPRSLATSVQSVLNAFGAED